MTLDDLRQIKKLTYSLYFANQTPTTDFYTRLSAEIISSVENWGKWQDDFCGYLFVDDDESTELYKFAEILSAPKKFYGDTILEFTRDHIIPAIEYTVDYLKSNIQRLKGNVAVLDFPAEIDCYEEYINYQNQMRRERGMDVFKRVSWLHSDKSLPDRRPRLLSWIKRIYKPFSKHIFMQKILMAGLVLNQFTLAEMLRFTRQWRLQDSEVINFLQSIDIPAKDIFTDADIRNAENFIVDTLKKNCPSEILRCRDEYVQAYFDVEINMPFGGKCYRHFKPDGYVEPEESLSQVEFDRIANEESQANIIPFEVYQRHQNIVDAFKDDSTLIYDSDAKLYPSTAQIGNVEHPPRDKPSMREKLVALVELNKFRRLA